MKTISLIILMTLLYITPLSANQCQLNGGAYISHSKINIMEAQKHVWTGKWAMLKVMLGQGKLKKIIGAHYIDVIESNDKYVKFTIPCAPGKQIWTLTIFTQGCK